MAHAKQTAVFSEASKMLSQRTVDGPSERMAGPAARNSWLSQTTGSREFQKQAAVMREARILGLEIRQKHLNGDVSATVRDRYLDRVQAEIDKSAALTHQMLRDGSERALDTVLAKGDLRSLDRALKEATRDVYAARSDDLSAGAGRSEKTKILMQHELELRKARLAVTRETLPRANPRDLQRQADLVELSNDTFAALSKEDDAVAQDRLLDLLLNIGAEIDDLSDTILHESGALRPLQ